MASLNNPWNCNDFQASQWQIIAPFQGDRLVLPQRTQAALGTHFTMFLRALTDYALCQQCQICYPAPYMSLCCLTRLAYNIEHQ